MRLEQLRFLCEIVDRGFNVSRAAEVLNTSQPGVSKQIRLLETELRFEILRRRKGRIVGLTEPGAALLPLARKILRDAGNIASLRDEFSHSDSGQLVIATTHLHACYVLPRIVERFRNHYPQVRVSLLQGDPEQIVEMISTARADIGITGEPPGGVRELIQLPCYEMQRSLTAPRGHPLLRARPLTLVKIAQHPLIAYNRGYPGGMALERAFEKQHIEPDIVIRAIDSEVIKAYVKIGLGVAVLPSAAFVPEADTDLGVVDVTHLFGPAAAALILHPEAYLREYMYDFIQQVAPQWSRERMQAALGDGEVRTLANRP